MFCERCGRMVTEDDCICPECGNRLRDPAPADGIQYQTVYGFPGQAPVESGEPEKRSVLIAVLIASMAVATAVTYYTNLYMFFLFIPILGIGRGARMTKGKCVMMGVCLGLMLGVLLKFMPL